MLIFIPISLALLKFSPISAFYLLLLAIFGIQKCEKSPKFMLNNHIRHTTLHFYAVFMVWLQLIFLFFFYEKKPFFNNLVSKKAFYLQENGKKVQQIGALDG